MTINEESCVASIQFSAPWEDGKLLDLTFRLPLHLLVCGIKGTLGMAVPSLLSPPCGGGTLLLLQLLPWALPGIQELPWESIPGPPHPPRERLTAVYHGIYKSPPTAA